LINLYDIVLIKENRIEGTVVDISYISGRPKYVVESNAPSVEGGYGGKWKLFDCDENEIELIKTA